MGEGNWLYEIFLCPSHSLLHWLPALCAALPTLALVRQYFMKLLTVLRDIGLLTVGSCLAAWMLLKLVEICIR